ncbi:MAG: sensor histidine kinase [Phenylobacterium sp.]|nr:sensor histidine kinase [Phenylobacterium sp.]
MRDIADHLQAEEPAFRRTAEALSLGVPYRMLISADGGLARFLHVGAGCVELTGLTAETILADSHALTELVAPEDRDRLTREHAAALAEGRASSAEVQLRRGDGELRWCRLTCAPQLQPDGSTVWDGLMIDVTESRRLAEQLVEERRRLEQALEVSGLGVFQWAREDPDTVLWSERQYEIFGVPPATPITVESYLARTHPDDRGLASSASRAAEIAPDGGDFTVEHRIVRRDGQVRWLMMHGRIRRDAAGLKAIQGTTLDVTERRLGEERGRLQMRELAHRGKNALSVLMAMVKHAARNARSADELAVVLLDRLGAMAESQDLATASEHGSLPLSQLIARVLGPFDLKRFAVAPDLDGLMISGDTATGLALLLHELATNAMKYGALSAVGGRVSLRRLPAGGARAAMEWREIGGPPVTAPTRQGFGTRLVAAVLQGQGGKVEPSFAAEGFSARIEIRLT